MNLRGVKIAVWLLCLTCLGASTIPALSAPPSAGARDWLTVSGRVVAVAHESFSLDSGRGLIFVDVAGAPWYEQLRPLLRNHDVTVYGRLDRAATRGPTLQATAVYDRSLGTFFRSSNLDEQDAVWAEAEPPAPGYVEVIGQVTRIHGRELTLTSGITVDTSELRDNPLYDQGDPRVRLGDRIKVGGYLRADLAQRTELMATWLTKFCVSAGRDCAWQDRGEPVK